jgi:chromosome segregation ATPase
VPVKDELAALRDRIPAVRADLDSTAAEVTEIKRQAREFKQEMQTTENVWDSRLKEELQQTLNELVAVRTQIQAVRGELDGAVTEMGEMKRRYHVAREELQRTESALQQLRQAIESANDDLLRQMSEDVRRVEAETQVSREQVAGCRAGYLHELAESQKQLEELQEQSWQARTRFLTIGQDFQTIDQEMHEVQDQLGQVRLQVQLASVEIAGVRDRSARQTAEERPAEPDDGKAHLGMTVSPEAVVLEVWQETPAEKAGLQQGDRVLEVAGKPVATGEDLKAALKEVEPGKEVELKVTRGSDTRTLTVRMSAEPVEETVPPIPEAVLIIAEPPAHN